MRRLLNLLMPILIISSSTYGQDISDKYPDLINRIKQINNDKALNIITLENEEFLPQMTDGGGELTGYFKKDQIKKISRKIGLSYGIEIYDYYFSDEKLILVYETLDGFVKVDSSGKWDYTKTERNFTGRYYFKNGKLIDSETAGHNRFEDDTIDVESTLTKEMAACLDKLKREKSNNAR